jgi:hypothetical protein
MCLICIEYPKGKLTPLEGLRNLEEMRPQLEEEHYLKTYNKLYDDHLERELERYWESIGLKD